VKHLWPYLTTLDLVFSLGTGTVETSYRIGPQSPVKDRSLLKAHLQSFYEINGRGEGLARGFPQPYGISETWTLSFNTQPAGGHISTYSVSSRSEDDFDSFFVSSSYSQFDEIPVRTDMDSHPMAKSSVV